MTDLGQRAKLCRLIVLAIALSSISGCGNGKLQQIEDGARNVEHHAQTIEKESNPK